MYARVLQSNGVPRMQFRYFRAKMFRNGVVNRCKYNIILINCYAKNHITETLRQRVVISLNVLNILWRWLLAFWKTRYFCSLTELICSRLSSSLHLHHLCSTLRIRRFQPRKIQRNFYSKHLILTFVEKKYLIY